MCKYQITEPSPPIIEEEADSAQLIRKAAEKKNMKKMLYLYL